MAILRSVSGLKVSVCVNKVPLEEYDADEDELPTNAITKYIEAVTGCNFEVYFTIFSPFAFARYDVVANLNVDGKYMDSFVIGQDEFYHRSGWTFTGKKTTNENGNHWFVQKFQFSQLNIGEHSWTDSTSAVR